MEGTLNSVALAAREKSLGLVARFAGGDALERIDLRFDLGSVPGRAEVRLEVRQDFALLAEIVEAWQLDDSSPLRDSPISRRQIMPALRRALGLPQGKGEGLDEDAFPPPRYSAP
jgi:hypothetical protein